MRYLIRFTAVLTLISCASVPRERTCYKGKDPLAQVTRVLKYGVFWKTQLPYENPHAYTYFYTTFIDFHKDFPQQVDCWTEINTNE